MKPPTKIAAGPTGMQRQMTATESLKTADATGKRLAKVIADPLIGPMLKVLKETSAAVLKSRAKNPEKYREYQRDYMRKKRAEGKAK